MLCVLWVESKKRITSLVMKTDFLDFFNLCLKINTQEISVIKIYSIPFPVKLAF